MVGLTGQSLLILEDLYFACFDDACSLSHFLPRSTSSNQLGVNCDIVITPRNASACEDDSVVRQGLPSEVGAGEPHDWIGRKCMLRQRATKGRQDSTRGFCPALCSQDLDLEPQILLPPEMVPLENRALFSTAPQV